MLKKHYSFVGGIVLLALIAGGVYLLIQNSQNKFVNFKDPKLTNQELTQVEEKIIELESAIAIREQDAKSENQDKKADLFKLEMELSSYYRLRGRLLDAKKIIIEASKILPDNASPWNELYVIEQARGDFQAAEQALLKSLQINSANPQAWRWYFELASGPLKFTPEQQVNLYTDALAKTNGSVDILALYAGYLEKNNDLAGAVTQWKKAAEVNPAGQSQYQAEIERIQGKLK